MFAFRCEMALGVCCVALTMAADCSGQIVAFWQDPVVTHTNGVRLASSTSQRSHNMYWQPDTERQGYCDGRVYSPMRDDLCSIGSRRCGFPLPVGPQPGPVSNGTAAYTTLEGVEPAQGERLGMIPSEGSHAGLPAGFSPRMAPGSALGPITSQPTLPQPTPAAGGIWLDAIQQLGEKMMGGAQGAQPMLAP